MNVRKRTACIALLIAFSTVFLLVARHNHMIGHRTFPWHLSEKWYCEEIDMTLEYVMHEDGYLLDCPNSILIVDDRMYEVFVGYYGTNLVSFLSDLDGDGIEEMLLHGVWNYNFGKLVIRIREDNIFDGQYRTLVFVPCDD